MGVIIDMSERDPANARTKPASERFTGPPRHKVIGEDPRPTILDDLRDLWADIAGSPTSHALVAFAGVLVGLAVTLGPALVWSFFL